MTSVSASEGAIQDSGDRDSVSAQQASLMKKGHRQVVAVITCGQDPRPSQPPKKHTVQRELGLVAEAWLDPLPAGRAMPKGICACAKGLLREVETEGTGTVGGWSPG